MGRLIDADVVEDILKKCVSNAYKRRDVQCAAGVNLAILELRNIPTAYDVEKVVEELKSLSNAEADYYYAKSNDVIDREKAIDIVNAGGVE